jgi:Acyl-CoA reductase (LuxC)
VYVARSGRVQPLEFAQQVAAALAALQHKFARQNLSVAEAAGVAAWRQAHEFKAMAGSDVVVLGQSTDPWCVVYANTPQPLMPSALNRCVLVVAVDGLYQGVELIAPQKRFLQSVGVAVAPEELVPLSQALADAGVTRVCAIGSMTAVQEGWHHDGRFSLLDLVRWVDIEASAEAFAEQFSGHED